MASWSVLLRDCIALQRQRQFSFESVVQLGGLACECDLNAFDQSYAARSRKIKLMNPIHISSGGSSQKLGQNREQNQTFDAPHNFISFAIVILSFDIMLTQATQTHTHNSQLPCCQTKEQFQNIYETITRKFLVFSALFLFYFILLSTCASTACALWRSSRKGAYPRISTHSHTHGGSAILLNHTNVFRCAQQVAVRFEKKCFATAATHYRNGSCFTFLVHLHPISLRRERWAERFSPHLCIRFNHVMDGAGAHLLPARRSGKMHQTF